MSTLLSSLSPVPDPTAGEAPPVASRIEHRELRHGAIVVDDYHWLRDKNNPEVIRYLEAENAYTEAQTAGLKPFADALYQEMLGRMKQTDLSVPVRRGDFLYFSRTEEGKQYPIYCRRKSPAGFEEVLLDLNQLGSDRKFVGVGSMAVSDDGQQLAYTVDFTGFRQYTLQVKDLRSGRLLPDAVERVTSVAWASDNNTLLVTTEDPVTKRSNQLLRHSLEGNRTELVYEEEDELYDIEVRRTRDKNFIVLDIASKDTTECRFLPAKEAAAAPEVFLPRHTGHRYYIDHRDELFYVRTNKDAEDFQIVTTTESARAPEQWTIFVSHRPGHLLESVDLFRDFAVVNEKSKALNHLHFHRFASGEWNELSFPEPVYTASGGETPDFDSLTYRYTYGSFLTPRSVFDYHPQTATSKLLKQEEVLAGYDPSQYGSERLWATARDGVKVPISIVYKKGLKRDGKAPLFLYAYGSYGIGMPATFSSHRLSLLDRGMAYAIAHVRGGDELGERWRKDGMLMKKKNTFYDFIDCAEYLVQEKWTASDRLVVEGGSAGGLLMGAVVNMRPDLFKAVHAAVPFVDVMNTMMDATLPLTVGEYLEWGNPNEQGAYDYMKTYSPYDNLEKRAYPAMLVTTSLNDSQVMYWEPAKYVAKLRTLKADRTPLLLKVKMEPAGHGGASGRYDRLKDTAFEYAWMLSEVGIRQ